MKRNCWIWVLLVLIGFGCYDTSLDATAVASDSDNQYLVAEDFSGFGFQLEPYTLIGITPDRSGWDVIVEYSGGCEDHEFYAIWNGVFLNNNSGNYTSIELGHVGNFDPCEALIRDTVRLEFNRLFNSSYPDEGATITLNHTLANKTYTVQPELAEITQGNFCNINAKLVATPCGSGIWGNKWLKVQDSVKHHDLVWFQPVTNTTGVSLDVPLDGDYNVGITLLFGYEFQIENSVCQVLPEGTIIPISVNCMERD